MWKMWSNLSLLFLFLWSAPKETVNAPTRMLSSAPRTGPAGGASWQVPAPPPVRRVRGPGSQSLLPQPLRLIF
eukprot:scaffold15292_cov101-Isochrysis_galbana.AAC.2